MNRTCCGCRSLDEPQNLLRLVVGEDGTVVADLGRRGFGRGAWVHPSPECIGRAPKGLSRAFKRDVRTTADQLVLAIRSAANRRIGALIASAKVSGKVAIGTDAVHERVAAGGVEKIVVATDARAAATAPWVAEQVAAGRALAWGTKSELGASLGRGETGVVGVLDRGFADALTGAVALAHIAAPPVANKARAVDACVEVR